MRLAWHIAWRYLFSRKRVNAINIVSGVSAAAVAVVSAAMICVLSVMNGFGDVIQHMFSQFDPQLKVVATSGTPFRTDAREIRELRACSEVSYLSEVVENTALVRYGDKQTPAQLMGVDSVFARATRIDSILTDGEFCVRDEGDFERTVLGRGLAGTLGVGAHFLEPLYIYAPKRVGRINMMRPDKSLKREHAFIAGTFAVNQVQYDDHVMLVSLPLVRRLYEYDSLTVTSLHLRLQDGANEKRVQRELQELLGADYRVLNRYEQQEDFFRMFGVEKLLTALLLVFILLVASFNIISSLTMLILDKQDDIRILSHLGATPVQIRRIFLLEGWLISLLGALVGLVLGVGLCLMQQHYGLLKLGSGEDYILSAYPVLLSWSDVAMVMAVVVVLGFAAAWYPAKKSLAVGR